MTLERGDIRPACRGVAMSDNLTVSDNTQNASLTVPPQALSSVAMSSSICNSGDSMNEDKSTIDPGY